MVATTRAENTHNGPKTASRPKTTKMSQLIILYYLLLYGCNHKSREHTMAPNQPADQKKQRCRNRSFSVTFPSLLMQPQEHRAHHGSKPASRPKTSKISQLLILYYFSFSMVATKSRGPTNGPKPSQETKNNQDVTITYSLLRFLLYMVATTRAESTQWP